MGTETNNAPSSLGRYVLDSSIRDLQALIELSPIEYLELPKRFPDDQIFKAPGLNLLGHDWRITIGARSGYIRKIYAENIPLDQRKAKAIFARARSFWIERLGNPTEESSSRIIWDVDFGNVIIGRRDAAPYVSLSLTSRHQVRSHSDKEGLHAVSEQLRNTEFILKLGLSNSQLQQWLWLRAAEWANLPSFVSQPIVPIFLIFFYWPVVLVGVLLWTQPPKNYSSSVAQISGRKNQVGLRGAEKRKRLWRIG
jgi:hypothetical protein